MAGIRTDDPDNTLSPDDLEEVYLAGAKILHISAITQAISESARRTALAAAIVHQPRLLFLDEPTSGVDPLARRAFWDLIYALSAQGVTIMVTTHYLDEAEYCSLVGIMRAGRLLALEEPGWLKSSLPGKVWEVSAEPLLAALKVLEGLPGVRRATLASDHLRLVASAEVDVEQISGGLAAAGLAAHSVRPGDPTIEDVFMTL